MTAAERAKAQRQAISDAVRALRDWQAAAAKATNGRDYLEAYAALAGTVEYVLERLERKETGRD